ncbi:MAG TPA: acyl carrier protein [Micromonosporaceae bacterium]|nr:acyl carrier protein [Micromonosporaceae bacterium]
MTDVDELPLDASFFDLGLTSLRLSEIKQGLEARLGCGINANVLFNRPTVAQLMTHLTDDVLADLFAAGAELGDGRLGDGQLGDALPADGMKGGPAGTAPQQLWDSVLDGLYRA